MTPKKQEEFVACYEAFFWLYSRRASSVEELNREYKTHFTEEEWRKVLSLPKFAEFLAERGVPNPYRVEPKLTTKQLDFLRAILDPTDSRLLAVKMKAHGVTAGEHAAWMRDPVFARLVREETTKVLQNGRPAVLKALVREASGGNVSAIKFYMELTGEFVPKSGNQVTVSLGQDVRELTQGILEILQRHIEPAVLMLVADELEQLLFPAAPRRPVEEKQVVPGVIDVLELSNGENEESVL